jgi:hypothetical protein
MLRRSPLLRALLSLALIYAWLVGGMASAIAGGGHGHALDQKGSPFEICLTGGLSAAPDGFPSLPQADLPHDFCCISHAHLGAIAPERSPFVVFRHAEAGKTASPPASLHFASRPVFGPHQPRAPPQA